jgi:hypothetical protein
MLMRRVHSPSSSSAIRGSSKLSEAGLQAYQKALKERLPLAHIADQSARPQFWFANNIWQVVGVFGKVPGDVDFLHLTRAETGDLKLADDMVALFAPDDEGLRYEDLRVSKADFEKYMEWARTVY